MTVAEAAAAAMLHYYNKNIIHITKENYYAQIQAGPLKKNKYINK
jgi:RAB protein geranylgeranyltransferase component A